MWDSGHWSYSNWYGKNQIAEREEKESKYKVLKIIHRGALDWNWDVPLNLSLTSNHQVREDPDDWQLQCSLGFWSYGSFAVCHVFLCKPSYDSVTLPIVVSYTSAICNHSGAKLMEYGFGGNETNLAWSIRIQHYLPCYQVLLLLVGNDLI